MKRLAGLILVILVAVPCYGQYFSVGGGFAIPNGDFSDPTPRGLYDRGAKLGFMCSFVYNFNMGPLMLNVGGLYYSMPEKEKQTTLSGVVAKFRHEFFVFRVGAEKQFFHRKRIQPFGSISLGLYNYRTKALDESNTSRTGSQVSELAFKFVSRPGIRFATGFDFNLYEKILQIRLGFSYTKVFIGELEGLQGVEGGALKMNYPYPYYSEHFNVYSIYMGINFLRGD